MPTTFTRADYDLLPEGFPAQLVAGQLVREPAPTYGHQALVGVLFRILAPLVEPELLLTSPVDVVLDEHNVFQPDLVVLRHAPPSSARDVGIPVLAVEIVSPATRARDRRVKTPRLLRAGVQEVWLIDAQRGTVECRSAGGREEATGAETLHSSVVEGISLCPSMLFGRRP